MFKFSGKPKPLGYRLFREMATQLWGMEADDVEVLLSKINPYSISYEDNWEQFRRLMVEAGINNIKISKGENFYKIFVEKDGDKVKHTLYLDIHVLQERIKALNMDLKQADGEEKSKIRKEIEIEEHRHTLLLDTLRNIEK